MAVLNGKLYFSWVQHSRLCILDSTSITANSNWQLAASQCKCLRFTNGGQHA